MLAWRGFQSLFVVFCVVAISVRNVCASDVDDGLDEPAAKLVLYKYSDTNPVVEGKDFVISYQLINVGNTAATLIEVGDRYDSNSFETVSNVDEEGIVSQKFEEIAPGSQSSFNVTVRAKLSGVYESTRARVRYASGVPIEDVEPDFRQGYSTSLGRTRIISTAEAERNNEYFAKHWVIFGCIYAIPTLVPFFLWNKSKAGQL